MFPSHSSNALVPIFQYYYYYLSSCLQNYNLVFVPIITLSPCRHFPAYPNAAVYVCLIYHIIIIHLNCVDCLLNVLSRF